MAVMVVFDRDQVPIWIYYLLGYLLPFATGKYVSMYRPYCIFEEKTICCRKTSVFQ
jgi:hypothetical protein